MLPGSTDIFLRYEPMIVCRFSLMLATFLAYTQTMNVFLSSLFLFWNFNSANGR